MPNRETPRADVLQGTLDLMVLQTVATLGPLHGYAIAARLEQVSTGALQLNMGTLYPGLMRLEQRGLLQAKWGVTDNNRRARFYAITAAGRRQLATEKADWARTSSIMQTLLGEEPGDVCVALREWVHRLWGTLRPRRADRDLEEELRLHLDLAAEDARTPRRVARAMRRERPRLKPGDLQHAMEALRDQRGLPWLEDLARDLRLRLPDARQKSGFTVVAVLSLAIGIGANTADLQLCRCAAAPAAAGAAPRRGADGRIDVIRRVEGFSVLARVVPRLRRHPRSQHELRRAGRVHRVGYVRVCRRRRPRCRNCDAACW